MPQFLAIVAYRSLVAGASSGSIDFQVRWFDAADDSVVRQTIEEEPICAYRNETGSSVAWELAEILSIEPFSPRLSGEEVVGFIAPTGEILSLA